MAESVRLILIELAFATLVAPVTLEPAGHGTSDACNAFAAVVGTLVGQHLEKPSRV